jgi:sugar phosphate isomerase/epimerase
MLQIEWRRVLATLLALPGILQTGTVFQALLVLFLLCTGSRTSAQPDAFFAMDTAIRDLSELDTVKALGYDGISWRTGPRADVAAALRRVQQCGLKLFAVYDYQSARLTETELVVDPYLDSTMEALHGTNAVIWMPITSEIFPPGAPDGDEIAVPALRRLADRALEFGLRVAIYPHMNTWTERVQDAVRLATKVGRRNLGVTFNLCHCLMAGDESKAPALLAEAMPYLFLATINGADSGAAGTTWTRLIRPLGEGSYDVTHILKLLSELHYSGPIGLQGFGVQIPVTDNLTRSFSAWRRILDRR